MTEIPLFPLPAVLFPDGFLPLRIFEQRYLSMVRECARDNAGFGVCLILGGGDPDTPVTPAQVGTLAQIVDWYTLEYGLLGVSAIGTARFVIRRTRERADGLLLGAVDWLSEAPPCRVPEACSLLTQVLSRFMEKVGTHYPSFTPESLDDAAWVGYRLSELLPLGAVEKQHLLELHDPLERLRNLMEVLPRFQSE